jgi:hypothetical protein
MRSDTSKATLAAVLALALLLAACGGDKKDAKVAKSDATTTSTTATTIPGETTVAGGSTTTAKATTTTAPKTGPTRAATTASGAPAPANSGTYDYNQSGTSTVGAVPPRGTLAVDPANSSGVQVWHLATDPSQPPNDTTIAFRADGPFITDIVTRAQGLEYRCHFDAPVPAPPWPATDGKPISGHANCGAISVDVSGSITGHQTATVGGKSLDVVVAKATITTHGQVESTSEQEQWWAPSIRIPTHTHTVTNGRFGAFSFKSDVTTDLVSTTPH